jgi:NAD(P)-dependent dehydrogenase (short-subunit alcohol dehydrogenase family)
MRTGGSVILIGSVADSLGVPGNSTYSATKAALRSYVRTWTREFTDRGIRFNTLSPGPVDTPMMDAAADSVEAAEPAENNSTPSCSALHDPLRVS